MSEAAPESPGAGTEEGQGIGDSPGTGEEAGAGNLLPGTATPSPDELSNQVSHWRDMAKKNEKRARENASAAARLAELEEANKTDLQKAQDALSAAERERDEARADHSRVMAAAAHNLPVELIDHLGAGTDDEINDRAGLFAKAIETMARQMAEEMVNAGTGRNGSPAARPVESMRAGSAPASGGTPSTPEQWFRQLVSGNE